MIALVDYGAGNLRSVENALRAVGAEVKVTHDPEALRRAERIVVPGQGSMKACADAMRGSGCADALVEAIGRGAKVLGICVGLQMLFERGEEHGGATGLGLVPGTIARLPDGVKLPHIGWSPVRATSACHALFRPLDGEYVYFAHSFAAPAAARGASLLAHHGRDYCAALADGNVFAVQFHPEKSQKVGLALLRRFVEV
ncbi:MAG TPA: imidazole glycerol phosphate synthase subunit HisH [Anaeromyxobacteraceae bacterium]|nr:imidazole glycerol phosphate synthase subunit HisH [Anaeromyxobacteraceae bacterium]